MAFALAKLHLPFDNYDPQQYTLTRQWDIARLIWAYGHQNVTVAVQQEMEGFLSIKTTKAYVPLQEFQKYVLTKYNLEISEPYLKRTKQLARLPSGEAVSFLSDGIIVIYNVVFETGHRKRAIEVLKMRGDDIDRRIVELEIVNGKGCVVYPKKMLKGNYKLT